MSRPKSIDRQQVLDAAQQVVLEHGASHLTIDAVAKAVGITKGGVQSCFGTKEKLVAALLERAGDEYLKLMEALPGDDVASLALAQKHIRTTVHAPESLNAKAASLLAALLQMREQLEPVRQWYDALLGSIDLSSEAGRRHRLAVLAAEGAFMLRYFGLANIGQAEWEDMLRDIERCAACSCYERR